MQTLRFTRTVKVIAYHVLKFNSLGTSLGQHVKTVEIESTDASVNRKTVNKVCEILVQTSNALMFRTLIITQSKGMIAFVILNIIFFRMLCHSLDNTASPVRCTIRQKTTLNYTQSPIHASHLMKYFWKVYRFRQISSIRPPVCWQT